MKNAHTRTHTQPHAPQSFGGNHLGRNVVAVPSSTQIRLFLARETYTHTHGTQV